MVMDGDHGGAPSAFFSGPCFACQSMYRGDALTDLSVRGLDGSSDVSETQLLLPLAIMTLLLVLPLT